MRGADDKSGDLRAKGIILKFTYYMNVREWKFASQLLAVMLNEKLSMPWKQIL